MPFNHLMGHLIKYIQSKVPVYALEVKYVFSVKTLDGFLYADALFEYHAREKDRRGRSLNVPFRSTSVSFRPFVPSSLRPFVLSSFRSPFVLLSFSFRSPFVLSSFRPFVLSSSPLDFQKRRRLRNRGTYRGLDRPREVHNTRFFIRLCRWCDRDHTDESVVEGFSFSTESEGLLESRGERAVMNGRLCGWGVG